MKVTSKGQVTIPVEIRRQLGIDEHSEVQFVAQGRRVYLRKVRSSSGRFRSAASVAKPEMTTDEIMKLTRDAS